MYFHYDQNGDVLGFTYKANTNTGISDDIYYYVKNLQGDIIGILNSSGTEVASYTYDAWGNHLSQPTSGVGALNPLRYRGYQYDTESGLYYLHSRYYAPEIGRFISTDAYAMTYETPIGANMFAYCGNNPVMGVDDEGEVWHLVVGGMIGGVVGAISAAVSGGSGFDVLVGAATGAVGGVLAASGAGVVTQAVGSAALSMASNALAQAKTIAQDKTNETKFDVGDMLFDGAVGFATGVWGGNGASYGNARSINSAGKQLFKRGFFDCKARAYYAKVAHNSSGEYVFSPLLKSLGKNTIGSIMVSAKNILKE